MVLASVARELKYAIINRKYCLINLIKKLLSEEVSLFSTIEEIDNLPLDVVIYIIKHSQMNIQERMKILSYIIKYYPKYDFISLLDSFNTKESTIEDRINIHDTSVKKLDLNDDKILIRSSIVDSFVLKLSNRLMKSYFG